MEIDIGQDDDRWGFFVYLVLDGDDPGDVLILVTRLHDFAVGIEFENGTRVTIPVDEFQNYDNVFKIGKL